MVGYDHSQSQEIILTVKEPKEIGLPLSGTETGKYKRVVGREKLVNELALHNFGNWTIWRKTFSVYLR